MSRIEEQLASQPALLAGMGKAIVHGAPEMAEWLEWIGQGQAPLKFTLRSDDRTWFRLYRHQGQVFDRIADFLFPDGIVGEKASLLVRECRRGMGWFAGVDEQTATEAIGLIKDYFRSLSAEDAAVWREINTQFRQAFLAAEEVVVEGESADTKQLERMQQAVGTPEFQFFLLVWIPCFMLYGEWCHRLYWQSRCGNLDALEKLLSTDKRLLCDPRIARHADKLQANQGQLDRLADAIRSRPRKLSRKQVKVSSMALLSSAAKMLRHPLTAPQIAGLFHALVQEQNQGLRDLDLPRGPETLAKAIQRAKPHWDNYLDPDKKISQAVRARKKKSA